MNETDHLDLMLNALTEIMQEEKAKDASPQPTPVPVLPTLSQVLARLAPLPQQAIFLGMANDGLPVLLNLYDPVPGPILIAGDKSSGKTKLLQTIARAAEFLHSPDAVQYGVVTTTPEEWKSLYGSKSNAGIYQTSEENTGELLQSLVTWAHNNRGEGQSILLLIDDLDAIVKLDEQAQQNLRWLLLRGPSRRVWTFITLNANRAEAQKEWLEFFRTRLFGSVENSEHAILLTGNSPLNHLSAGDEFAMREGDQLLKFWLPAIN
ncbi:MAG: hypothetical protein HYU84_18740 [Chloroflexi bacterium]|nr:hypothetical protein [Chloroflexota bacterium]